MRRFDKSNIVELKALLYESWGHDAKIESVCCDYENESMGISLINPFVGVRIDFTFHVVELALSIKGKWHGNRQETIGITAEDDFSYLEEYLPRYSEYSEDSLYLLFQMFSGDELHIVSKEVIVEIAG